MGKIRYSCGMGLISRLERKAWKALIGEGSYIDRRGSFRNREQWGRIIPDRITLMECFVLPTWRDTWEKVGDGN